VISSRTKRHLNVIVSCTFRTITNELHLGEKVGNSRVRVRFGVEHQTSHNSGKSEQNGSSDNNSDGPWWQQRDNVDDSLLISVGEFVSSSGHVGESSSLVQLVKTSVEVVGSRSIQDGTVLRIFFSISGVSTILSQNGSVLEAIGLIDPGKSKSQDWISEEGL